MTDVSNAIYSGDLELYPRKDGTVCLQDLSQNFVPRRIVLTEADALEVWRVLNKWVERNARVENERT